MLRRSIRRVALGLLGLAGIGIAALAVIGIPTPPSFTAQNVPRVSWKWAWKTISLVRKAQDIRGFAAWYGHERKMLITVGSQRAVHLVAGAGAPPERLEGIPLGAAFFEWSRENPRPYVVFARDEGGSERYRFFRYDLTAGTSTPLTSSPARAYSSGLDAQGRRLVFSSNERNGTDTDIYVVDTGKPESKTMVYRARGDYYAVGWAGDGRLLAGRFTTHTRSEVFLLDPASGAVPAVSESRS